MLKRGSEEGTCSCVATPVLGISLTIPYLHLRVKYGLGSEHDSIVHIDEFIL